MKETLLKIIAWLIKQLVEKGDLLFWGFIGSGIATLVSRKEQPRQPLWHSILMFCVGLAFSTVIGPLFTKFTGLEPGPAGFVTGLAGWALTNWFLNRIKRPLTFIKDVKNLNDDESGTI